MNNHLSIFYAPKILQYIETAQTILMQHMSIPVTCFLRKQCLIVWAYYSFAYDVAIASKSKTFYKQGCFDGIKMVTSMIAFVVRSTMSYWVSVFCLFRSNMTSTIKSKNELESQRAHDCIPIKCLVATQKGVL